VAEPDPNPQWCTIRFPKLVHYSIPVDTRRTLTCRNSRPKPRRLLSNQEHEDGVRALGGSCIAQGQQGPPGLISSVFLRPWSFRYNLGRRTR
jgi:hypothetical protein